MEAGLVGRIYHRRLKKVLVVVGVILGAILVLLGSIGTWAYYRYFHTAPLNEQGEVQVPLHDEQLRALDTIVGSQTDIEYEWRGEALFLHDVTRRMVQPDGTLDARSVAAIGQLGDPLSLPTEQLGPVAQRILYSSNVMLSMERLPTEEQGERTYPAVEWLQTQKGKMNTLAMKMVEGFGPTTGGIRLRFESMRQDAKALRELIAMRRHALRHGETPASIDQVDADLRPGE